MSAGAVEGEASAIPLAEFFEDDQLRLYADDAGWVGFERDGDAYYWIDTRLPEDAWPRRLRVGPRAVKDTITRWFSERDLEVTAPRDAPDGGDRGPP